MSKELDKILRDKLYGLEADRPIPSWQEMQRRMTLSENAAGTPSRRPHRWMAYAGAAALVALMLGVGMLVFRPSESDLQADLTPLTVPDMSLPGLEQAQVVEPIEAPRSETPSVLSRLFQSAQSVTAVTAPQQNPLLTAKTEPTVLEGFDIQIAAESLFADDSPVARSSASASRYMPRESNLYAGTRTASSSGRSALDWDKYARRKESSPWMLSAFTSAFASSQKNTALYSFGPNVSWKNPEFNYADDPTNPVDEAGSGAVAIVDQIQQNFIANFSKISGMQLDHRFPISVGLSVKKHFKNRWGIESGLTYTYLESTGEGSLSELESYNLRQQVHYLGIPLYVSYSLYNTDRWDIYLNGGFMAEVALAATQRARMYYSGKLLNTLNQDLDASGVLWSTSMGGGISYYMLDNFGIYLEPAASYYFPNAKQPVTYRTQNPWSFNVRLGLRVKF